VLLHGRKPIFSLNGPFAKMEKINSILQKIEVSVHAAEPDPTLILYGSYAVVMTRKILMWIY